jgi:ABC-type branched-subunit amino acid transport system substrate-binding protein
VAVQKARELDIPIIILTQKEGLAAAGSMIFQNFLTPTKEISEIVDLALNEMGIKRFGVLYPDNSYGRYFMNLFWDQLNERGGTVTAVESYPPEATDFGDQIKKMVGLYYPRPESIVRLMEEMKKEREELASKDSNETNEKVEDSEEKEEEEKKDQEPEPFIDFEAVFIPDNYNQVALIAPQFPFYRLFNIQLLGTSLWDSQELIDQARDYVQGAVFPVGFFKDQNSEAVQQFIESYRTEFDADPGLLAATGYDTIRLLKRIFENHNIMNRRDVQTSLELIRDFQGVTGKISFDEQGEVEKKPFILTISGNRIVELKNMGYQN